jgi:hypothetical protein
VSVATLPAHNADLELPYHAAAHAAAERIAIRFWQSQHCMHDAQEQQEVCNMSKFKPCRRIATAASLFAHACSNVACSQLGAHARQIATPGNACSHCWASLHKFTSSRRSPPSLPRSQDASFLDHQHYPTACQWPREKITLLHA